jgi:hypothetical protein
MSGHKKGVFNPTHLQISTMALYTVGDTVIGDGGVQSRPEASLKYIKMGNKPIIVTQS